MNLIQKRAAAIPRHLRKLIPGLARKFGVSPNFFRGGLSAQQNRYVNHILSVANSGRIPYKYTQAEKKYVENLQQLVARVARGGAIDSSYLKAAFPQRSVESALSAFPSMRLQVRHAAHKLPFDLYRSGFRFPKTNWNYNGIPVPIHWFGRPTKLYRGSSSVERLLGVPKTPDWQTPNPFAAAGYAKTHSAGAATFEGPGYIRVLNVPKGLQSWIGDSITPHVAGNRGFSVDAVLASKKAHPNNKQFLYNQNLNPNASYETVLSPSDYKKILDSGGSSRINRIYDTLDDIYADWELGTRPVRIKARKYFRWAPVYLNNAHGQYPLKLVK